MHFANLKPDVDSSTCGRRLQALGWRVLVRALRAINGTLTAMVASLCGDSRPRGGSWPLLPASAAKDRDRMSKRDWLLLALDEAAQHGLSPVQVQKTMFLFWKGTQRVLNEDQFYEFSAHNFGPFSSDIYRDLDLLSGAGLVRIDRAPAPADRNYRITERGSRRVEQRVFNERAALYLRETVPWVLRRSFSQLVRHIYERWPEYRKNSIFVY
jgi:hypothetical protein